MTTINATPESPKGDDELLAIIQFYETTFQWHVDQADSLATSNPVLANLHAEAATEAANYELTFRGILQMRYLEKGRGGQGGVLWLN